MEWDVAGNIVERLKDLMAVLDVHQAGALGRRAGVGAEQARRWMRAEQAPPKNRLELWAEREGWPIEIFAEGGPMPSAVLLAQEAGADDRPDSDRIVQLLRTMSDTSSALSKAQELLAAGHVDAAEDVLRRHINIDEYTPDNERD